MNLTLILLVLYPIYAYIIVITILYIRKVSRDKKGIEERYTEFTKIEEEFLSKLEEAKKEIREELTNEFDDIIKSNMNYQMMELEMKKFKWTKDMKRLDFTFSNLGSEDFDNKLTNYCSFAVNSFITSKYLNNPEYRRLGSRLFALPELTDNDRQNDIQEIFAMVKSSLSAETYSDVILSNFDLDHNDGIMYIISRYIAPVYNSLVEITWSQNSENTFLTLNPDGNESYVTQEEIEAEQDNELYEKLLSAIDDDFNKVNTQAASKKKDEHRIVINKLASTDDILNDL